MTYFLFQAAPEILLLLQVILFQSIQSSLSYPSPAYGTKRYGRSTQRMPSYDPYPIVASQRFPVSYYKLYPYSQSYPDEYYYPQDSYPLFYPPRTSNYEVYQAVMPYYYQDTLSRPGYSYYGYQDPANAPYDWQEEMIQEAEREEREEAQPIGHESFYENDDSNAVDSNIADTNAAFLQNLILTQMYQDSLQNEKENYENPNNNGEYEDSYGKFEDINENKDKNRAEDENVRELKKLQKGAKNEQLRKQNKNRDDIHWTQTQTGNKKLRKNRKPKEETKRSDLDNSVVDLPESSKGGRIYADRKPFVKAEGTGASSTTEDSRSQFRGQKEEFQMRPATPVRHPFSSPILAMMSNSGNERKRAPSVYDTLKHMLDIEKSLENVSTNFYSYNFTLV